MSAFGDEVKRLAEKEGLTQAALAEACGVHQTFIGKLVRGDQAAPRADVLFRLAAALGVPTDHFKPFLAPEAAVEEPAAGKKKKGKK